MAENDLRTLFIDELRDIYDAENQLIKALPDMAEAATSQDLRAGFERHLDQTRGHAQRLEQIFNELGEKVKGTKCKAMKGLIDEGKDILGEDYAGDVMDAALISAAQRVEHYEIAAYGTVREFATILGQNQAVTLLEQTLQEEKDTNEKLTELSQGINSGAAHNGATPADGEASRQGNVTPRGKAAGV